MKIVICIKLIQSKLLFADANNKYVINPFDYYAVEQAVALRKEQDVHITALMMGVVDKRIVVELKALGCDEVIYLSDSVFAGADTLATSYVLAKGFVKIRDYDLIFCGDHSLDGETGHIGASIAERLLLPYLGNVMHVSWINNKLSCETENAHTNKLYHVNGPCVISFKKFVIKKTKLSLMQLRKVHTAKYTLWAHEDIEADVEKCGVKGSRTKVISAQNLFIRNKKNTQYFTEDVEEKTNVILGALGVCHVQ